MVFLSPDISMLFGGGRGIDVFSFMNEVKYSESFKAEHEDIKRTSRDIAIKCIFYVPLNFLR